MFNEDEERQEEVIEGVLFVDPGLGGTGYAFFEWINTAAKPSKVEKPSLSGVIKAPRNEAWDNRVWSYCVRFSGILSSLPVKEVVIEFPELFSGSAMSQASAGKGDLFKLTYLIGGLADRAREYTGRLPILMIPRDWKGQLPKDVVIKRIGKTYGDDYMNQINDHEADAIGMGLSAQGRL